MSLYAIDQRVWVRSQEALATVTEANYVQWEGMKRHAHYVVKFITSPNDWACGSKDLRAADWCCDGCGRWLPGRPYRTAPDGEYPNGLSFCFLCVEVP
jgi:hypothetical protein